jgi:hypothetical protein
MIGAQASQEQQDKIYVSQQVVLKVLNFLQVVVIVKKLVKVSISTNHLQRTQQYANLPRRNFWTCLSVTTFKDFDDAIKIANDTIYGLGAGVWSRSAHTSYRAGRAVEAVVYGQTVITSTLPMLHLVVIKNQVLVVKTTNDVRSLSTNQEFIGELFN